MSKAYKSNMSCHKCIHKCVCGNSSCYLDAVECKQYKEFREYEELIRCKDMYERSIETISEMNRDIEKMRAEIEYWKQSFENQAMDMARLQIIKKTLEVITGRKFDN